MLEGKENKIIIGFPNKRGTIIDLRAEIIIAETSPKIISAKSIITLANPIFIKGRKGTIGGSNSSRSPITIAMDSKIPVYDILISRFLFFIL